MIFHITQRTTWETAVARGRYLSDSFHKEGFIHCSTLEQVLAPANRLYKGEAGLVLLCITPKEVNAPLVYEDIYHHGEKFPHIYGALNINAVQRVIDFPPNADGTFSLPPELQK